MAGSGGGGGSLVGTWTGFELCVGLWLIEVIFEDSVYTNRSGTPSWTMSLLMCKEERILTTATKTHAVV